jgi:ATP-binding cassette subfamily F protein uup
MGNTDGSMRTGTAGAGAKSASGSGAGAGSGASASGTGSGSDMNSSGNSRNTWKGPKKKTKLSYQEQREYDSLEGEIDKLSNRSEEIDQEMIENSTNSMKLSELQEEKERVDAELEAKMERFFELEELVASFEE